MFSRPQTLELDRGPPKPCGIPDRIRADVENAPRAEVPKKRIVTLPTMARAAKVLGKRLRLELA